MKFGRHRPTISISKLFKILKHIWTNNLNKWIQLLRLCKGGSPGAQDDMLELLKVRRQDFSPFSLIVLQIMGFIDNRHLQIKDFVRINILRAQLKGNYYYLSVFKYLLSTFLDDLNILIF